MTRDHDNGSHSPRAVRFVRPGGVDSGDCSDPANPCATLSYAVSQALGGDVVRLAVGSHPSGSTLDGVASPLTIQGGWSHDFTTQSDDPLLTVVTGDGLNHTTVDHLALTLERLTVTGAQTGVRLVYWWPRLLTRARDHRQLHKSLSLDRCVVQGNTTGVLVETFPLSGYFSLDLSNSQVVDNAGVGVKVVAYGSDVVATVTSSTLAGNGLQGLQAIASGDEPADAGHAEVTLTGALVWDNGSADVDLVGSVTGSVDLWASHTDLGVLTQVPGYTTYHPGTGVLSLDPGFAPGTGPRRLTRTSPCVDSDASAVTLLVDFEGDRRPADGDGDGTPVADMGADELPEVALFADDFESGSTSSWSLAVPDYPGDEKRSPR